MGEERKKPLRIKACPTEKAEDQLLKIEVESNDDLDKLADRLDSPIMACKRGHDAVVDARDKVIFFKKREK